MHAPLPTGSLPAHRRIMASKMPYPIMPPCALPGMGGEEGFPEPALSRAPMHLRRWWAC